MSDTSNTIEKKRLQITEDVGKWLGWSGIAVGVVGFFWLHIWLGAAAIVLGVVGLFSPQKILNSVAIAAGAVALILGFVL